MFNLDKDRYVIDAAFRLHNFVVDYRNSNDNGKAEMDFFTEDCLCFMTTNPNELVGTFGNGVDGESYNVGDSHRGRNRKDGKIFRDSLRDKLKERGLTRGGKSQTWNRTSTGIVSGPN